ncbi:DNA-binding domain-containing protein [uncultured Roseobacter sp.]|uniref:DNA-binding domain-containing protein n=1 Tax=uncultured Roseobacter sp. TaxID=114847 RepID=UPI00260EDC5E|nr:DNA-binding domain-containing protein [uncultured Roseobacter sp.]
MTVSQSEFRAALLDADRAVPEGLQNPHAGPAGARFSVYRNNVVVSLTEALATAFPLVRKLIGTQTFGQLAGHYVRENPPASPLMMYYGETFPEFLSGFAPLSHIGYLADCARLDLAFRRSYHAADAASLDPAVLQTVPETLMAIRLAPAPSTIVIRSRWPLFDLWRFNNVTDAPKPRAAAQDVLVTRPEFDPAPHLLPHGAALWFDALARGSSLGEAHAETLRKTPDFDLAATLTLSLTTEAFAAPE